VAAEDDVLNFQVGDGVFDYGSGVDIIRGDDVRDVAVDEYFAGLQTQEGGFGDAGVGAAEPDLGLRLAFCLLSMY
jgi:hypothetical protein